MTRYYERVNYNKLVEDYKTGNKKKKDEAVATMCKALKGFIIMVMKREYPTYIKDEFDDMLQCGYLAIIQHFDHYDPQTSTPTTYFYIHIKQALQLHLNSQKNQSSIYYQTTNNKIQAITKKFQEEGIELSDKQVSEQTGLPVKTVHNARAIFKGAQKYSLDESIDVDESSSPFASPEAVLEDKAEKEILYEEIEGSLSATEKKIIYSAFGLRGSEAKTDKEIAKELQTTTTVVTEAKEKALGKLRVNKTLMNNLSRTPVS